MVLQVRGRSSASIDGRPQARLLQHLCREKHTQRLLPSGFPAHRWLRLRLASAVYRVSEAGPGLGWNAVSSNCCLLQTADTSPSSSAAVCSHAIFTSWRPTGFAKHRCCVALGLVSASSESLCSVHVLPCVLHAIIIPSFVPSLPSWF